MRTTPTVRSLAVVAAIAALMTVGCGRAAKDDQPLVIDTSGGSIADSSPTAAATGVVALLSDENVFALLDTAYAAIITTDQLGQAKATSAAVRDFATTVMSQDRLARSGVKSTAEKLQISPVLPDRDVIRDQAKAMETLHAKQGLAFDAAYLDRVIQSREALIDEIDDALEGKGAKQLAVVEFLRELRANLESDRQKAADLRRTITV